MNTDPRTFGQGIKKQKYPKPELMESGHLACPGCGAAQAMRLALKSLSKDTVVVIPACCWAVIAGPFPYSNLEVPLMHAAFETSGATASGIRAALDIAGKTKTTVMVFAGDGGTFDIGLQSLSAAAEREENIIYVCYDNEAYMNTGIQRSSATPLFAWTTTTPVNTPKMVPKKDIDEIMLAHHIPYLATTSPAYPHDLLAKFKKANQIKGFRFIHILSSCSPGWKIPSEKSVAVVRAATESNAFPIYEVEDGKFSINIKPENPIPIREYLLQQGRFRHLTEEQISIIQEATNRKWRWLLEKERSCNIQ